MLSGPYATATGEILAPAAPRKTFAKVVLGVALLGPFSAFQYGQPIVFGERTSAGYSDSFTAKAVGEAPTTVEHLQTIKRLSGLNWSEVASALGVSRRSLYNWLEGTAPTPARQARIVGLRDLLESLGIDPTTTTRVLRTPTSAGSPLDLLGRGVEMSTVRAHLAEAFVALPPRALPTAGPQVAPPVRRLRGPSRVASKTTQREELLHGELPIQALGPHY